MRLAIHLQRTLSAKPLAALLCLAAMTLPGGAVGQSRETLGEGDSVRITVFQNPDLTTETRISERGTITFPLIGEIAIAGLTPAGAEARIAEQLIEGKSVLKPQVSLNVIRVRSRQVSVLGQVARPGRYPLDDTSSNLTDILALAGGISSTGDDKVTVMIARNGKTNMSVRFELVSSSGYRPGRATWPSTETCRDRKSTRLNSSHVEISYAVFCLKKKKKTHKLISLYKEKKKNKHID